MAVCNDGPGRQGQCPVGTGVFCDRQGGGNGALVVLECVQLLGGQCANRQCLLMPRKFGGETQRAGDACAVPVCPLSALQCGFVFSVGKQCGITGFGGFLMFAVAIGSPFVLQCGIPVRAGTGQQFGVQEVHVWRLLAGREGTEEQAVPASGLGIGSRFLQLLCLGMIMLGDIAQVALYLVQNIR